MRLKSGVAMAVAQTAAAAQIQPLAWELSYATGVAIKRKKKKAGQRKGQNRGQ